MSENIEFFPEDVFGNFKKSWYSDQLRALNGPSFYAMSLADELTAFRFLWLRSFHNPIAIAIYYSGYLTAKVASGKAGYSPGKVIVDEVIELDISAISGFQKLIDSRRFWKLPSSERQIQGFDGSQWIIEGVDLSRYHIVDRWNGWGIKSLGLHMLKLSNMTITNIY